ncbi:hypothetical protein [Catellatospora chokoriensis]|uniref:Uncharacterized protein n=1 Tax=Catellatospora chokoriensis TaxID=310353 RepID=A0A8J3JSY1_9ACTN|nr:hypothetical protein [Catellatospora chokoriensis]GIF90497.1 hypothetical protein Cch02nite_39410 [Catellatospora chokoriensis]
MSRIAFPLSFDRRFELWSYRVSHGVLLLRSNIRAGCATRIDLMFRGVTALKLRDEYKDLVVDLLSLDAARAELGHEMDAIQSGMFAFSIRSASGASGYVVASSVYLSEDDMDYGEPSSIDHPEFEDRVIRAAEFR